MSRDSRPPFALELVDADPAFELVVEQRELDQWAPAVASAGQDATLGDGPPFAADLISDQPPHLEQPG